MSSLKRALEALTNLKDAPWRWAIGIEAALAMAIPAAAFTAAGYASEGLIASLGAFTVLHFASASRRQRAIALPFVAIGLVLSSAIGVLGAGSLAFTVAGLVLTTAVASLLMLGFSAGPPGALMFVVVAGVSGYFARRVSGGASAPLLVAAGAVTAYLVAVARLLLSSARKGAGSDAPVQISPHWELDYSDLSIAGRVVLAAAISGLVGAGFGVQRVYWVVIASIAILQTTHTHPVVAVRAAHRVLGSVLGLCLFGALAVMRPAGLVLVGLLALLQCAAEVVIVRNYGLALAFITPIPLLISTASHAEDLRAIIADRLVDTLLGAAVALVVFWSAVLLRPDRIMPHKLD